MKSSAKPKLPPNAEWIEQDKEYTIPELYNTNARPVIVGIGPAGLFCGLVLAKAGLKPLILERGECIEQRIKAVEHFFATGELNTSSNIQFGEGGAGTFSDGKLNTLVKDKEKRGRFVLSELVKAGAPDEILYVNKPHVGTDMLRCSIQNVRREIEKLGGTVLFEHNVCDFDIAGSRICGVTAKKKDGSFVHFDADSVFLCIGHSARDTFSVLRSLNIPMERKPFAVGVRIEHKQKLINDIQYNGIESNDLPAADYKLVCHTKGGRGVYTFCMCPGGEVVAAASEEGQVVTNGMSNFNRDGENANAALLVEIRPEDFPGDDILAGVEFQRRLEKDAFIHGGGEYRAPAQTVEDFLSHKPSAKLSVVQPTYSRGVKLVDLHDVLPPFITEALEEGLHYFNTVMKGFAENGAVMTAVESRSSSPVRILRDMETLQSDIKGLYPVGEGAGYAGGIMSAAMDGMKAAEKYIATLNDSK